MGPTSGQTTLARSSNIEKNHTLRDGLEHPFVPTDQRKLMMMSRDQNASSSVSIVPTFHIFLLLGFHLLGSVPPERQNVHRETNVINIGSSVACSTSFKRETIHSWCWVPKKKGWHSCKRHHHHQQMPSQRESARETPHLRTRYPQSTWNILQTNTELPAKSSSLAKKLFAWRPSRNSPTTCQSGKEFNVLTSHPMRRRRGNVWCGMMMFPTPKSDNEVRLNVNHLDAIYHNFHLSTNSLTWFLICESHGILVYCLSRKWLIWILEKKYNP